MFVRGDVRDYLAVLVILELAEPPAPLPLDPDGGGPLPWGRGRVEHDHGVRPAEPARDLGLELPGQRHASPGGHGNEFQDLLTIGGVAIDDGLGILPGLVGQEA
jgi:hypothetical protein